MSTDTTSRLRGAGGSPQWFAIGELVRRGAAVWIVVVAIIVVLSVAKGSAFWAPANLAAVLTGTVVLGLVALGQHIVVLTGGIDLSVGSTATLSALLTAVLIDGYPIRSFPVLIGVLLLAGLIGGINGLLVARVKLPPFIVTLATFYIVQGAALLVSSRPAGRVNSDLTDFALGRVGPFPFSLGVLVVAILIVVYLLQSTVWGRHVFAVGGDPLAARSTGINVSRTLVLAYLASGFLAGAAGILLAARSSIGSPTAGAGLELSAITVVVIGGASLLGGRGTVTGTLGGVLLLTLITSSMTLLQLPATWTDLIRGAVIIAAAAIFVSKSKSKT